MTVPESVSVDVIGYVFVGVMLFAKGALDAWSKLSKKGKETQRPLCACQFTPADRLMLEDLHRSHCGQAATDPIDGLPRWYSRDLARAILKIMRKGNGGADA